MAQSRHAQTPEECPLLGAKRTLTNRCLPISIYEYTALILRERTKTDDNDVLAQSWQAANAKARKLGWIV
jgi:hypothetical protein